MEQIMLRLRPLMDEDIPVLKKWLYQDYVLKWFENPENWLHEAENREGAFHFIRHFIVVCEERPIGFCQYYDCFYAQEEWYEAPSPGTLFSIDYLIGEKEYLKRGFGRVLIETLTGLIREAERAEKVIVRPDLGNVPSCCSLLAAGYYFDDERGYYYKDILVP